MQGLKKSLSSKPIISWLEDGLRIISSGRGEPGPGKAPSSRCPELGPEFHESSVDFHVTNRKPADWLQRFAEIRQNFAKINFTILVETRGIVIAFQEVLPNFAEKSRLELVI